MRLLLLGHFSPVQLCDPIDGSPPGYPVPGILQARTLEWVAVSFSNAWKWNVKVKSLSHVRPSATPWTAAHQAPPSMGFSRQEYWSGVPLPFPASWLKERGWSLESKPPDYETVCYKMLTVRFRPVTYTHWTSISLWKVRLAVILVSWELDI